MNKQNPERATETVFYVPNDAEGQAFIKAMRKYLNRANWKMRPYSRNPNRKQYRDRYSRYRLQSSVPLPLASYYGVYIWSDTRIQRIHDEQSQRWRQLMVMEAEVNKLRKELDNREAEALGKMLNAMKESERTTVRRKIKVTDWS